MAYSLGFFAYLSLKIRATLLRIVFTLQNRRAFRQDQLLAAQIPVTKQRVRIPSRDPGRFIVADVYYPPSLSNSPTAVPVLVNWHGSGWVLPYHGSDTLFCAQVAQQANIVVVDADYRKAPEHPHPAIFHDVEDTLRWVGSKTPSSASSSSSSAALPRFDTIRVAVSGFSAGACEALIAGSVLRKALSHLLTIVAIVAVYPATDLTLPSAARTVPRPVNPLPSFMLDLFTDSYVPDPSQRTDPRASPAHVPEEEFAGVVVVVTADGDTLAPEAEALAKKLDVKGRRVVLKEVKGVGHGFDKGGVEGGRERKAREGAYEVAVEELRRALET
ncbi:Alpha/Beta hydrolase protein [Podospora appendiculata]|uniref:Alpha/Beta hydrolase protein n=1 Tax=Podospora appendiculata TaxID=314037 RepID=A0AAE1CDW1_9PEZI|nr:Alpha/Beta hydrolase protein [Podospora appendiculata]